MVQDGCGRQKVDVNYWFTLVWTIMGVCGIAVTLYAAFVLWRLDKGG